MKRHGNGSESQPWQGSQISYVECVGNALKIDKPFMATFINCIKTDYVVFLLHSRYSKPTRFFAEQVCWAKSGHFF